MRKKKEDPKPSKVRIIFEVEESSTHCCECVFGASCPYVCPIASKLDCKMYDLATLKLTSVEPLKTE